MAELGSESRFSTQGDFDGRVGDCWSIGADCSRRDKLGKAWGMVLSSLKRAKNVFMRLGSLGNRLWVRDFCAVAFLRIALRAHVCTGGKEAGLSRERTWPAMQSHQKPQLISQRARKLEWPAELWIAEVAKLHDLLLGLVFSQKRPWLLERPGAHLEMGSAEAFGLPTLRAAGDGSTILVWEVDTEKTIEV